MFIRWISRLNAPIYFGDGDDEWRQDTSYSLILAESYRDKGKPRQRHIAYLGGITDYGIKHLSHRCDFWDQVTAAFDRLANRVPPEDRKRFEAAIATKVPRPSAQQRKAVTRERVKREQDRQA